MATTITPNMNLILPIPGQEAGPQYANDLNGSLQIVDGHNHTLGSGVPITPSALNLNSNVDLQNNLFVNVGGLRLTPMATSVVQSLYIASQSGGGVYDLFYNDGAGNQIALTKAGLVNATIASIPGESYAGGTFKWVQGAASTTPANFDLGQITLRPNTAGTANGIVLQVPSGIASQYPVVLPALPANTSFLTIDSSGNMTATIPTAAGITSSNIASGTITGSNIAAATITGSNLVNNTVTATQIANATITTTQISSSAGITNGQLTPAALTSTTSPVFNYTGSTFVDITNAFTINTTGRMVLQQFVTSPPVLETNAAILITLNGTGVAEIRTTMGTFSFSNSGINTIPVKQLGGFTQSSPGTMAIQLQCRVASGSMTISAPAGITMQGVEL